MVNYQFRAKTFAIEFKYCINNYILEYIRICTELQASLILVNTWTIIQAKLNHSLQYCKHVGLTQEIL